MNSEFCAIYSGSHLEGGEGRAKKEKHSITKDTSTAAETNHEEETIFSCPLAYVVNSRKTWFLDYKLLCSLKHLTVSYR